MPDLGAGQSADTDPEKGGTTRRVIGRPETTTEMGDERREARDGGRETGRYMGDARWKTRNGDGDRNGRRETGSGYRDGRRRRLSLSDTVQWPFPVGSLAGD